MSDPGSSAAGSLARAHRSCAPLVIFGCGFAGTAVARAALARGRSATAFTRSHATAEALRRAGLDARSTSGPESDPSWSLRASGADVLIAFAPDGTSPDAMVAVLSNARSIAYLSTTGVYGAREGRVDEHTPPDDRDPRNQPRLATERLVLSLGGTVLRAAGLYGPGRGLHLRLRDPEFAWPDGGVRRVSRVHVDDLATVALGVLATRPRAGLRSGDLFVVADDAPASQLEVARWLAPRLGVDLAAILARPPRPNLARGARSGRAADNGHLKRSLELSLRYPTFVEGYGACLARAD